MKEVEVKILILDAFVEAELISSEEKNEIPETKLDEIIESIDSLDKLDLALKIESKCGIRFSSDDDDKIIMCKTFKDMFEVIKPKFIKDGK